MYWIGFLPWMLLIVFAILIQPLGLFLGGKIMKVQSPNFNFKNCIWANCVAGILAGLLSSVNLWLAIGVYLVFLWIILKKQFQVSPKAAIVMLLAAAGLTFAYEIAKIELFEWIWDVFH